MAKYNIVTALHMGFIIIIFWLTSSSTTPTLKPANSAVWYAITGDLVPIFPYKL